MKSSGKFPSEVFNQPGARFVLLPLGKKAPPIETEWQNKPHTFKEASAHKGNIGIISGNGFIGLDEDDPNAFAGIELPQTTKWETRPGRLGFLFKCLDDIPKILSKCGQKADLSQIKLYDSKQIEMKNGKKSYKAVGEIKLQRAYQVIPPSFKRIGGNRVDYKLLEEVAPADISLSWLTTELQKLGIRFSSKPELKSSRQHKCSVEDNKRKNAGSALDKEIEKLASTIEGDRNNQLNKSSFYLGQLIAGGLLDEEEVVGKLTAKAIEIGLKPEEIQRTIQSGIEAGKKNPIQNLSQEDWKETVKHALVALSNSCDGAHSTDGRGFNIFDAKFCNDLADKIKRGEEVSEYELRAAFKRLQKYSSQLSAAGISLPADIPESSKESMGTKIVDLVLESGAELWHSTDGKEYITFDRDGHNEHYSLKSETAKHWLAKTFFESENKSPGTQAIRDALNVLQGKAMFDGPEYPVYVRVAPYEGKVYVDLGNNKWEAIEVSPQGWSIITNPPVRFRRPKAMRPLPSPQSGGNWQDLQDLLGIQNKKIFMLIVGWIMQAYWPRGPYAHLVLTGEQGSGKSGLTRTLKSLVDPSIAVLRRPPREERDLMIAAQEERIIAYDNLSGLRLDLSDAICVLSTGGSLAGRKLYTDDEEAVLVASRPVILNGIDAIATRGDLQDRSIILDLPRISEEQRIKDSELSLKLEKLHPAILGLILDATVIGLKQENQISLSGLPRMADFAAWAAACEPALPWEAGEFMQAYKELNEEQMVDLVEDDPFANAVIKHARDVGRYEATPTRLWKLLVEREGVNESHPPCGWPKNAKGLKNKLKRIAPQLQKLGIEISYERSRTARLIKILLLNPRYDNFSDDSDDIVTTQNRQPMTTVTSVTTQNQLSLTSKNGRGADGVERHEPSKDEAQSKLSSSSLSSPHIESSCHHVVITSSQNHTISPKDGDTCSICGWEIGPGHGSQPFDGKYYCASCVPTMVFIRVSVNALTEKNNRGPTLSEICQDIADRGRPPNKKLIPTMLKILKFKEADGMWIMGD